MTAATLQVRGDGNAPPSALQAVMLAIQSGARLPELTTGVRRALLGDLQHWRVQTIIVGPMGNRPTLLALFRYLLDRAPVAVEGVAIWWHVAVYRGHTVPCPDATGRSAPCMCAEQGPHQRPAAVLREGLRHTCPTQEWAASRRGHIRGRLQRDTRVSEALGCPAAPERL